MSKWLANGSNRSCDQGYSFGQKKVRCRATAARVDVRSNKKKRQKRNGRAHKTREQKWNVELRRQLFYESRHVAVREQHPTNPN